MLVLKCLWCGKRKGKPTEVETDKAMTFTAVYGFTLKSLIFADDGRTYLLPTDVEAALAFTGTYGLRLKPLVSADGTYL
jgi:hypothetical protein